MKLLEERRTRVSLMVALLDASAKTGPITSDVRVSIKNRPELPILHRLGYWLFPNLPTGSQTLIWNAIWFVNGQQVVNVDTLPRLRPLVEVQLTPLLKVTLAALAQAKVGKAYKQTVTTTGGKTPLRFTSTKLAAGLSLDSSTGVIEGTPTEAGQTNVTDTVTDSKGSKAQKSYVLKVVA